MIMSKSEVLDLIMILMSVGWKGFKGMPLVRVNRELESASERAIAVVSIKSNRRQGRERSE